jgi:hypothetical protein
MLFRRHQSRNGTPFLSGGVEVLGVCGNGALIRRAENLLNREWAALLIAVENVVSRRRRDEEVDSWCKSYARFSVLLYCRDAPVAPSANKNPRSSSLAAATTTSLMSLMPIPPGRS